MNPKNVLVSFERIDDTMLPIDVTNPIQLRMTVQLDHEIDETLLRQAWQRTLRVYPVLDSVVGYAFGRDINFYMVPENYAKHHDDPFYLVRPESGENVPVRSRVPIQPGSDAVGGRLVSVTFFENRISFSSYHMLLDGGGMMTVFRTLLYCYLALYTGHEDAEPVVELTEGRGVSEYYDSDYRTAIATMDCTPQPLYTLPRGCRGIHDPDAVNEDHVSFAALSLSVDEFMRFCRAHGSNPSSMLCVLLARAAYRVHPEERAESVFHVTISNRKILGRERFISNTNGLATVFLTREEAEAEDPALPAGKIRRDLDYQRTRDYQATFFRVFSTYQHSPNYDPAVVTYIGPLNIGENNRRILDFRMETNAERAAFLMQLNDRFRLMLQHGNATERDFAALRDVLAEWGLTVTDVLPVEHTAKDTPVPVL